jgi:hypothetical protein
VVVFWTLSQTHAARDRESTVTMQTITNQHLATLGCAHPSLLTLLVAQHSHGQGALKWMCARKDDMRLDADGRFTCTHTQHTDSRHVTAVSSSVC